jgi:hypothetical protein
MFLFRKSLQEDDGRPQAAWHSKERASWVNLLQAAVFQNLKQPELRFSVRLGEGVPEVELALAAG